jgi:hypothetical protein
MIDFFRHQAKAIWAGSHARQAGPGTGLVPAGAIQYHPSSYADPNGRLFIHEGRLYRGITAGSSELCTRLFDTGVVSALMQKQLLVGTTRSPMSVEGYAMVLEHQRVPHVSCPFEWCGAMLRAAALHTLDLLEELAGRGLTLKDAHGWNVLFEGCRPVFVDFGSITEARADGAWLPFVEQEFREYFLHPLELMAAGHGRVARALLHDFDRGIGVEECQSLIAATGHSLPGAGEVLPFAWYRERLASLNLQPISTGWSGYYDGEFPPLHPGPGWTPKHRAIHGLLQQYRPATVLDIGANRGWYAMLAATGGAQVTAFDNDEVCINQLFADACKARLAVQPLVMSYVNPAPRHGIGHGVMTAATERLQSDLVLGLALVHHMVFKMHLQFDQIAAGLAAYTKQTLVVEFPPSDDIHVSQWMTPRYSWYTLENFTQALRRHFPQIRVIASHPVPRVLLVCERRAPGGSVI